MILVFSLDLMRSIEKTQQTGPLNKVFKAKNSTQKTPSVTADQAHPRHSHTTFISVTQSLSSQSATHSQSCHNTSNDTLKSPRQPPAVPTKPRKPHPTDQEADATNPISVSGEAILR